DPPRLVFVSPGALPDLSADQAWFLGVDDDGTAFFAASGDLPSVGTPASLRRVGALLSDRDAGLLTTAAALEAWHTTHTHCARCGTPTRISEAGMVRVCPADGSLHHPRVDPAVIMTVVDDRDRLLLGHQAT